MTTRERYTIGTIKNALAEYLEYTTSRVKSALPLSSLHCLILQYIPTVQLYDSSCLIECEALGKQRTRLGELQGKWISIEKYTFSHKKDLTYMLIIDYFEPLPEESYKKPCDVIKSYLDYEDIRKLIRVHKQDLEREKIQELVDNLPSFDAIAMNLTEKQPLKLTDRKDDELEEEKKSLVMNADKNKNMMESSDNEQDEVDDPLLSLSEFERYVAWRSFDRATEIMNQKVKDDLATLSSKNLLEFTIDTFTGYNVQVTDYKRTDKH